MRVVEGHPAVEGETGRVGEATKVRNVDTLEENRPSVGQLVGSFEVLGHPP